MKVNTNFRNAHYDSSKSITCEIEHPILGWIPFTASADDIELHGRALYNHMKNSNSITPYQDNPE